MEKRGGDGKVREKEGKVGEGGLTLQFGGGCRLCKTMDWQNNKDFA